MKVRLPPVFDELVDDNDQVATATTFNDDALLRGQTNNAGMAVKLTFPKAPGTRILRMRGKINVLALARSQSVTSEQIVAGTPASLKAGDIDMIVEGFSQKTSFQSLPNLTVENFGMTIQFRRGDIDPARWKKIAEVLPTIDPEVLTAAGKPLIAHAELNPRPQDTTNSVRVNYDLNGKAEHLVPDHVHINVPLEVQEIGVPFEYKDIPIQ